MTQRVVEVRDIRLFAIDFVTNRGFTRMDGNANLIAEGVNLGPADGAASGGSYTYGNYFHVTDTYQHLQTAQKDLSTGGRAFWPGVYCFDALCQNPDVGWWQPTTYQPDAGSSASNFEFYGGTALHRVLSGQPNMRTMEQNFYWFQQGEWNRYRVLDSGETGADGIDVWPNIGQELLVNGAADGSTAGFWTSAASGLSTTRWHGIVFEGITDTSDGMAGETAPNTGMIRGSSSHPKGLGLFRSDAYNFDGSGTPSNENDQTWLWVDIQTGLAVGVLGVFARADSNTEEIWQTTSIDKRDGFFWDHVQFVPDADSIFSLPKGELHFILSSESAYTRTNQPVENPDGSTWVPTESVSQYFQVFDFNPFNQTGGVERIHNRKIQEGRFDIPYAPLLDGGSVSLVENSGSRNNHISPEIYYHPPSRSYVNVQASYIAAANNGTGQPDADTHRIFRWSRDLTDDAVSIPSADAAVIENAASYFDVIVTNDISGPVVGQTVFFETFRQSTRAESFDGTAQGASAYVVAQAVIDEDGHLDVRSGNDVDNAGTLLAIGVDYNVVYSTGTLTPIGTWPTATIYVRYRHRSASVTPGFGTLSAASAVTNDDGIATAIVLLPDNLDGELVGLNVDTETAF